MRRTRTVLLALLALAPVVACNIFLQVERCDTNSDCARGFVCDLGGGFCIDPAAGAAEGGHPPDAAVDAEVVAPPPGCDVDAPFGQPRPVLGFEDVVVSSARFLPGERTVVVASAVGCSDDPCYDLLVATRASAADPFVVSGPLGGVNASQAAEYWPTLSADGLFLFFESGRSLERVDGQYVNDVARIWSATRVNAIAEFSEPRVQTIFANHRGESAPFLHPSGRVLYFASADRADAGALHDLYRATLDPLGLASEVRRLDGVSSAASENMPVVSRDDQRLYFGRELAGAGWSIFTAKRPMPSQDFAGTMQVAEFAAPYAQFPSWLSDDQCRLYLISTAPLAGSSERAGPARLAMATRIR